MGKDEIANWSGLIASESVCWKSCVWDFFCACGKCCFGTVIWIDK